MVQVLRFDSNPGLLTGAKTWQGGLAWFQERLPTTKKNWVVVLSIFYFHPMLINIFQLGLYHQLEKSSLQNWVILGSNGMMLMESSIRLGPKYIKLFLSFTGVS